MVYVLIVSKSNQKFQPAYAGMDGLLNLSSSQAMFNCEKQLLPRQQFLMLVIKVGITIWALVGVVCYLSTRLLANYCAIHLHSFCRSFIPVQKFLKEVNV